MESYAVTLARISNKALKRIRPGVVISLLIFTYCTSKLTAQTLDGDIQLPDDFANPYISVSSIKVTGNKRTKENIIIRELDFQPGDSLATFSGKGPNFRLQGQKRFGKVDSSEVVMRMKYSRENIINTKLFLTVDLRLEPVNEKDYELLIDVTERWYFWVFPVVRLDAPNFNDWLKDPDLSLINMGLFMSHNNMLGLSHQASIAGYFGSSDVIALGYYIPWVGTGQKIGMRVGGGYQNDAVLEYASVDNERQMIYDKGSMVQYSMRNTITVRPALYNYSNLRIEGHYLQISDSLYSLAPDFFPVGKQDLTFINLYFEYYYDSRNSHAYPLKGSYLKGFLDKRGMGILSHDVDYFFWGVDFRFYQKLSERWYTAEMFKLTTSSSENIPYYFKQTLTSGDDFIRGYDYYALRGDEMYYFRSNLKYMLIKPNIMKARKEKNKDSKFRNVPYAFYLNLFADSGYMWDEFTNDINPLNHKLLFSWGLGMDLISYYDLVLRFEYAFTSIGTHGFFFGFGMPI